MRWRHPNLALNKTSAYITQFLQKGLEKNSTKSRKKYVPWAEKYTYNYEACHLKSQYYILKCSFEFVILQKWTICDFLPQDFCNKMFLKPESDTHKSFWSFCTHTNWNEA